MQKYIGTKIIQAMPMTRLDYIHYRAWDLPENENPADEGYLVEYLDGGTPNDPRHDGYISWSPREQFENAYNSIYSGLTFGHALVALEAGERVCRKGWNGKGMFIVVMPALYLPPFNTQDTSRKVNDRTAKWIGEDQPLDCQPYMAMYNAQKQWQPGWLPSQQDLFAKDWEVVRMPVTEANNREVEVMSESKMPSGEVVATTDTDNEGNHIETFLEYPECDAMLYDVPHIPLDKIIGTHLQGLVKHDTLGRFLDGTFVTTTPIVAFEETTRVATTRTGTRYYIQWTEAQANG